MLKVKIRVLKYTLSCSHFSPQLPIHGESKSCLSYHLLLSLCPLFFYPFTHSFSSLLVVYSDSLASGIRVSRLEVSVWAQIVTYFFHLKVWCTTIYFPYYLQYWAKIHKQYMFRFLIKYKYAYINLNVYLYIQ